MKRLPLGLSGLLAAALLCIPATAQVPQLLNYQGRVAVGGLNFDGTGQFKFALVDGGTNTSRQATAAPVVTVGFITSVTVIDGGAGYTSAPTATVRDIKGGGSGARLRPEVSGGAVTAITVLDAGSGYTAFASVEVSAPPPNIVYQTFWGNAPDTAPADGEPDAAVSLPVTKGLYSVLLGDAAPGNMAALPAGVFANPDVRLRVWFNDGTHGFQQLAPDARIAAVGYALMADSVPDGAIGADQLAAGAVTAGKIAAGAVGTGQLASGAITATQLAAGAVTSAKIAAGAVGTNQLASGAITATQLAAGAVTSAKIAAGAVGTNQLASGAVTATQLAKPPRSGSIDSSALPIHFGQAGFSVTFPSAFATTPVVTLAARIDSSAPWQPSLWVTSRTAAGFSGRVMAPATFVVLDRGQDASLAVSYGNPAVAYYDYDDDALMFVRAANPSGTVWNPPLTVDTLSGDLYTLSLAIVNGRPAIAYGENSFNPNNNADGLMYVRATGSTGSEWEAPITIDSSYRAGQTVSLAIVDGNPAIAYLDVDNWDLKYVRATDVDGAAWGTPIIIDGAGSPGVDLSLAVVDGNPAVAYCEAGNEDLKFARATNAAGTAWGTPITIDGASDQAGRSAKLAVVNGRPAVAYRAYTGSARELRFVRATNAAGTAWGTPLTVDSGDHVTSNTSLSLAIVDGNPAIAHAGSGGIDHLWYVAATDASGSAWAAPVTIDTSCSGEPSLFAVDGKPAVVTRGTDGFLRFVRAPDLPASFQVDWIALEP